MTPAPPPARHPRARWPRADAPPTSSAARRANRLATSGVAPREDTTLAAPAAVALRRLANRLVGYAPHDGRFQLRLPGAYAIRLSRLTSEAAYSTLGPPLCVASQRPKVVMPAPHALASDPPRLL